MLVLLWEPCNGRWQLQRVGAVGFRCENSSNPDPDRPECGTPEALLEPLRGWTGQREILRPQPGALASVEVTSPVTLDPHQLLHNDCSVVMPDGLLFSVPSVLPDGAFNLEIGGRLAADLFQQISIRFDALGDLTSWERCCFRPAAA